MWCENAAAACITTSATSTQNSSSCASLDSSARPSFGADSFGMSTSPYQWNGRRPLAESYSQPDSGIASSSAYSRKWVIDAIRSCQVGVPATGFGVPAYSRQAMRTSTSASTVMPVDLCIVYTQKRSEEHTSELQSLM